MRPFCHSVDADQEDVGWFDSVKCRQGSTYWEFVRHQAHMLVAPFGHMMQTPTIYKRIIYTVRQNIYKARSCCNACRVRALTCNTKASGLDIYVVCDGSSCREAEIPGLGCDASPLWRTSALLLPPRKCFEGVPLSGNGRCCVDELRLRLFPMLCQRAILLQPCDAAVKPLFGAPYDAAFEAPPVRTT